MKIAFLFLLTDKLVHSEIWDKFFNNANPNKYTIYSHIKKNTNKIPKYISDFRIKTIPTGRCEESLVTAFLLLVKKALEDPSNKFFILLSGECIPLYTFNKIYKNITQDGRSRISMNELGINDNENIQKADQWVILNRKSANVFSKIKNKYNYLDKLNDGYAMCPDEYYIINYFLMSFSYPDFIKNINRNHSTYCSWNEYNDESPTRINRKRLTSRKINEICESGALFARKFYKEAAKKIAMNC